MVAATLAACCPDYSHAAGGPPRTALVDNPFLPPTRTRSDLVHLTRAAIAAAAFLAPAPVLAAANDGGWITECTYVLSGDFDPIKFPGQAHSTHLHDFLGNKSINPSSTYNSMLAGATTCGTKEDHAGYWVPALYKNGKKIAPAGSFGGRNTREKFYYRADHYDRSVHVEPFPPGFAMIQGFADAKSVADANAHGAAWGSEMWWGCADDSVGGKQTAPVNCRVGIETIHITFPSCWDGVLVKGDEVAAGHLKFPSNRQCPAGFKHALPMLIERLEYPIGTSGSGVTLSSGPYYSAHADFWNTWQQSRLVSLTDGCMNAGKDCGTNPP